MKRVINSGGENVGNFATSKALYEERRMMMVLINYDDYDTKTGKATEPATSELKMMMMKEFQRQIPDGLWIPSIPNSPIPSLSHLRDWVNSDEWNLLLRWQWWVDGGQESEWFTVQTAHTEPCLYLHIKGKFVRRSEMCCVEYYMEEEQKLNLLFSFTGLLISGPAFR